MSEINRSLSATADGPSRRERKEGSVSSYLIRGVRIVGGEPTDLLIRDGVVAAIGAALTDATAAVIDAAGLVALPGLVDLHTHLREPGREDAETVETGSRAAALGGYTAVCAMANSTPKVRKASVSTAKCTPSPSPPTKANTRKRTGTMRPTSLSARSRPYSQRTAESSLLSPWSRLRNV